jgi:hypothetical protein
VGVFLKEEKVEQEEFGGPQAQVVRSLTRCQSKASPGTYSTYRINNVSYFTLKACDC